MPKPIPTVELQKDGVGKIRVNESDKELYLKKGYTYVGDSPPESTVQSPKPIEIGTNVKVSDGSLGTVMALFDDGTAEVGFEDEDDTLVVDLVDLQLAPE